MNEERDKFLTEAMGECWHERKDFSDDGWGTYSCKHCGKIFGGHGGNLENKNNFSTWEGFGKLYEWTESQPWFEELLYHYWSCPEPRKVFPYHFINPNRFADSLYKFLNGVFPSFYLKWKEKYEKQ